LFEKVILNYLFIKERLNLSQQKNALYDLIIFSHVKCWKLFSVNEAIPILIDFVYVKKSSYNYKLIKFRMERLYPPYFVVIYK